MERADRAPVSVFYAPGAWGPRVELDEAAAHHVQVKRLRDGDVVQLTSGDGRRARGALAITGKRAASVDVDADSLGTVPAPPDIALLAPVGDRERMLMLAEKAVELGVSSWHPVLWRRSRSVSPRGEGEQFRQKLRLRMIAALEQSGGAWLPVLHPERSPEDAFAAVGSAVRLLLDGAGEPLAALCDAVAAPVAIALGPEGGLEPDERATMLAAGWRAASLGANVLRFETAGIAALAIARAHLR